MGQYRNRLGQFAKAPKLNQATVAFNTERLLDIDEGAFAEDILDMVEKIQRTAVRNAEKIMARVPGLDLSNDISILLIPESNQYIIGIRDTGSITRYLADKEEFEHTWLEPAVEEVFD